MEDPLQASLHGGDMSSDMALLHGHHERARRHDWQAQRGMTRSPRDDGQDDPEHSGSIRAPVLNANLTHWCYDTEQASS